MAALCSALPLSYWHGRPLSLCGCAAVLVLARQAQHNPLLIHYRLIENKYFETVVLALILLSSAVMTLEDIWFETRPLLMDTLYYLDRILTVVFFLETDLKLFAMGCVMYFGNAWCWLDFVIVAVSLVNFGASLLGAGNIPIFKTMISQGIENSKAVIDAGLLIQNEAATYILNYKGLCQALCYKQLVASKSKLQNLEELIVKDQFTSQMLEDQLLLDQLLVEVNICDQVLLLMEKFELDFQETDNQTVKKKLHAFANVFKQFKNMIGSYFAVILQEGLKSCQQEKSMDVESAKIEAIIGETTNNLTDVINGVEKNLEASLKVAANIKDKFGIDLSDENHYNFTNDVVETAISGQLLEVENVVMYE